MILLFYQKMAEQASLGFVKRQSRCIILTKGEKNGETSIAYHFISFLYLVPHQNSSFLGQAVGR